jgi:transcriptional regulator with XRE-family HTH domain
MSSSNMMITHTKGESAVDLKLARLLAQHANGAGYTQDQLAVATGIHQTRLSRIENGYANATDSERERIEAVLGPIDWDITGQGTLKNEGGGNDHASAS